MTFIARSLRPNLQYASLLQQSRRLAHAVADEKRKERLVILGSGWGAMSLLKSLDQKRYDVYVVSPNTYFAMTPLLAQAATGTLELRAAMEPVRGNQNVHFYHAWVEAIDLQSQSLTLMPAYPPAFRTPDPLLQEDKKQPSWYPNARGGHSTLAAKAPHRREIEADKVADLRDDLQSEQGAALSQSQDQSFLIQEEGRQYALPYDKLVISVGAYNRTFNTPGVRENAWFLKDAHNARSIRWRILECFEQADHPNWTEEQRRRILTFLIVGGGPTGSEFAAELHDLIKTDLKRFYPDLAPLASISIIDASSGILNNFDASLSTYAREKFARDGIKLLLNRKVKAVEKGNLILEPDGEIPFGMLVWSTGISASPLVESTTSIAKDPRNSFFLTDDKLHVLAAPSNVQNDEDLTEREDLTPIKNVWAIGDCAQVRQRPLPATAQIASQKGKHLAYVLNGQMGEDTTADESVFKHRNMGAMASLGGGSAIVDSPKAKAHGRIAWVIWRSAYTYMSLSWRNRLLVPFYWTINRIFGRDLTRF